MRFKTSKTTDGIPIASVTPGWAGWLFFLIGVAFLSVVYVNGFRPQQNANGWKLFEHPDDMDLWSGMVVAVVCFTGAGAAILAQRSVWAHSRRWLPKLKQRSPEEPWRWRSGWAVRKIMPERPGGRGYFLSWSVLCLLSSVPGTEFWLRQGGWPEGLVSYTGLGAAMIGGLILVTTLRAILNTAASSQSSLHLNADTGVLGGPLEAAIVYSADTEHQELLVRLVCEKTVVEVRKTSEDTSRSLEVTTEYEDTYRASLQNGMIPVRFGIPFDKPETTTDWLSPVFLWFIELEDLNRGILNRFWIPVFKTAASDPAFELGAAVADRLMTEESPQACLQRHGITVSEYERDATGAHTRLVVPPGRAWSLGIGLGAVGVICLAVAVFFYSEFFDGGRGLFAAINIVSGIAFVGVFGLFGLLLTGIAFQLLFERRRIEFDSRNLRVRRSYFGLGWTTSLSWQAVKELKVPHSGSVSGGRREFKNVVAVTDGMKRRDGSMMLRRRSIINSVPSEAAEAARTLIESIVTLPQSETSET